MEVQQIENLDNRMVRYEKARRDFYFIEVPLVLTIGLIVCVGLMGALNAWVAPVEYWWVKGLIFACVLSVPPLKMFMPNCPSVGDVEADQELRRAFGMDDTVEPSNEGARES